MNYELGRGKTTSCALRGEVGRAERGETIHNLGVNHTIKNGFGISRQESVVIIINQIVYLEILSQMSGRRPSLLETR
jgi:hypothetical protein